MTNFTWLKKYVDKINSFYFKTLKNIARTFEITYEALVWGTNIFYSTGLI